MFAIPRNLRVATAAIALFAISGTCANSVAAASPDDAASFIRNLGNTAIEELSDKSVPMEKRVSQFQEMVKDSFALEPISRFVLGRYSRVATDEEMTRFRNVFLRVVTQRFLPLFEGYTKNDFVVDGAQVDPRSDRLFLVNSRVRSPQSEGMVQAGWRVQNRESKMQVVDVMAEGVSMAITLRSEYGSVIQQNGGQVSSLITKLEENVEKGAYRSDSVKEALQ